MSAITLTVARIVVNILSLCEFCQGEIQEKCCVILSDKNSKIFYLYILMNQILLSWCSIDIMIVFKL